MSRRLLTSRVTPLLVVLAASCAQPPGNTSRPTDACRVAPDGGPPNISDQGITGRGIADRGIGGTGAPLTGRQITDKGIGGTGVVGVITGFASVCLDGLEVGLPTDATITIDGASADSSQLRAGQLALITASPEANGGLVARSVTIRHEVAGPVDTVNGDELLVAGQRVVLSKALRDRHLAQTGMTVAISGVRRLDGAIVATRIDPARGERVILHGQMRHGPSGTAQIGRLELVDAPSQQGWLAVEGHYAQGRFVTDQMQTSPGLNAPGQMFGAAVSRVIAETYVRRSGDRLELGAGVTVAATTGSLASADGTPHLAVVTLDVKADGSVIATDLTMRSGEPGGAPPHNASVPRGQNPAPAAAGTPSPAGPAPATPAPAGPSPGGQPPGNQSPGGQSPGGQSPGGQTAGGIGNGGPANDGPANDHGGRQR